MHKKDSHSIVVWGSALLLLLLSRASQQQRRQHTHQHDTHTAPKRRRIARVGRRRLPGEARSRQRRRRVGVRRAGRRVGGRRRGARGGGRVALVGSLRTARVVTAARVGALILADAAGGDAVCAPLLADVVGEGLGVCREVGRDAVVADARGVEGVLGLC